MFLRVLGQTGRRVNLALTPFCVATVGVFCNQSAFTMRVGAGLARGKFALLVRSGSASWTLDGECLFEAEFLFHRGLFIRTIMLQRPSAGTVNFGQFFGISGTPVAPVRPDTRE
jgi:hypothetical protein